MLKKRKNVHAEKVFEQVCKQNDIQLINKTSNGKSISHPKSGEKINKPKIKSHINKISLDVPQKASKDKLLRTVKQSGVRGNAIITRKSRAKQYTVIKKRAN